MLLTISCHLSTDANVERIKSEIYLDLGLMDLRRIQNVARPFA